METIGLVSSEPSSYPADPDRQFIYMSMLTVANREVKKNNVTQIHSGKKKKGKKGRKKRNAVLYHRIWS